MRELGDLHGKDSGFLCFLVKETCKELPFCLMGERLSRLCNFARENQQREKRVGVFCGFWGKSQVVRCGFSVFLQKNLYEFSERGYNGTKGEFLISRIGG